MHLHERERRGGSSLVVLGTLLCAFVLLGAAPSQAAQAPAQPGPAACREAPASLPSAPLALRPLLESDGELELVGGCEGSDGKPPRQRPLVVCASARVESLTRGTDDEPCDVRRLRASWPSRAPPLA